MALVLALGLVLASAATPWIGGVRLYGTLSRPPRSLGGVVACYYYVSSSRAATAMTTSPELARGRQLVDVGQAEKRWCGRPVDTASRASQPSRNNLGRRLIICCSFVSRPGPLTDIIWLVDSPCGFLVVIYQRDSDFIGSVLPWPKTIAYSKVWSREQSHSGRPVFEGEVMLSWTTCCVAGEEAWQALSTAKPAEAHGQNSKSLEKCSFREEYGMRLLFFSFSIFFFSSSTTAKQ
ncbi:hypothetical protein CTRI78_v001400 [Colletotrichum trifolii]|uniref:Uncharacterized protein n=1 Tax=Colletotrichum trifolii TaxID=5466 RepID=A0A4R8RT96_COLTR|nr:hypothetical protein CTRI78_v001400 [Colletotrichum trifolii]